MSEKPVIECNPSKWFKIRAVLILLMLSFFALWFFKDGKWGYRDKNVAYVNHALFQQQMNPEDELLNSDGEPAASAGQLFKEKEYTKESWAEFASQQVVPTPKKDRGLLPEDYDFSTKWPKELVDGYDDLKKGTQLTLWNKVSADNEWPQKPSENLYNEGKISEQFVVGGVCVALFLIAAFICIRIMFRKMIVTEESYIAPGGKVIPFTSMHKIDKRKWDNKGIAVIYYKDGETTKKVKVDGMVYGQFKEEDGAPAEALFAYIMDNFKGELIEFVEEEDEEEGSEEVDSETKKSSADADSENS